MWGCGSSGFMPFGGTTLEGLQAAAPAVLSVSSGSFDGILIVGPNSHLDATHRCDDPRLGRLGAGRCGAPCGRPRRRAAVTALRRLLWERSAMVGLTSNYIGL